MVNTQLRHVPNVHTRYRKYFHRFLNSRLLSFARNSRKLMYREYYHVYSSKHQTSSFNHDFVRCVVEGRERMHCLPRTHCSSSATFLKQLLLDMLKSGAALDTMLK